MTNEVLSPRPASRVVSEFVDLAAKGAELYPTLMQAGITFWAKWLGVALDHYSAQTRQWALAVQQQHKRPEHVQTMIDQFKTYLASAAQVPGQAVLSFNQRVEDLLREPRPDPGAGRPAAQVMIVEAMEDLRRLRASQPLQALAGNAKVPMPDPDALAKALTKLAEVESQVLDARRAVCGALEGVLQFARRLSVQMEETEERPSDLLRRTTAGLERIRASLDPESPPLGLR